MSVDRLCSFYGFTRVPFGRDLAPGSLFRSGAHAEAVARLGWCVNERGLGTLTGEVIAGPLTHPGHLLRQPDRRRPGDLELGRRCAGWDTPVPSCCTRSPGGRGPGLRGGGTGTAGAFAGR
jgi:hypothetical protein